MGIYIHIPFCKQLCTYCDFYFSVSLERKDQLLEQLLNEIALVDPKISSQVNTTNPQKSLNTLYFGGGTPTIYEPEALKVIADQVRKYHLQDGLGEWTIEANPDDLTDAYLKEIRSIGVNRLSIGIQSFIDSDLGWMKRRHTADQARLAVKRAQYWGFDNISIDLIYGLPNLTTECWEYNIQQALLLNVQHISAYHLTIEPQTILGKQLAKGLFQPVSDDAGRIQYDILSNSLQNAGYEHYEVSNFALPNFRSQHNSSYWQQKPYLGFGPSAHGYDGLQLRYKNIAHNVKYIKALSEGTVFREYEALSLQDLYHEYLLTALRTSWGICIDAIAEPFQSHFLKQAQRYLNTGHIVQQGQQYKIPPAYYIVSDDIVTHLFY